MTTLILLYSAAYNAQPIGLSNCQPINPFDICQSSQVMPNTVLICDVRTGSKYRASFIVSDRANISQFKWPRLIEVAEIPENKALFLEYTTVAAPESDIKSQAERMAITEEELSRCLTK